MAFQQGLSGLNASSKQLDVIGNNIANSGTVGFKQSRTEFADLYANSLTGSAGVQVGIGTKVAAVAQQFGQGNITTTSNPLDIAISGNGFFRMNQNGAISYQRNGQFHLDSSGFIVNNTGQNLTGYGADTVGNILSGSITNLQVSTADLAPVQTANVTSQLNLDATSAITAGAFNINNAATYNDSTSLTFFDSLGSAHVGTLYFKKTASNAWDVFLGQDGVLVGAGALSTLTFSSAGALTAGGTPTSAAFTPSGGAAAMTLDFDLTAATQFGAAFGVTALTQDGFASGRLTGFDTDKTGIVQGRYTNGQTKNLGQVILASFSNPQGLTPIGNNQWVETTSSGLPVVGEPNSGILGVLQSGAVEDSNVDLTTELVNLIVAQRTYQANAQTIRAQDTILQTLVNLT